MSAYSGQYHGTVLCLLSSPLAILPLLWSSKVEIFCSISLDWLVDLLIFVWTTALVFTWFCRWISNYSMIWSRLILKYRMNWLKFLYRFAYFRCFWCVLRVYLWVLGSLLVPRHWICKGGSSLGLLVDFCRSILSCDFCVFFARSWIHLLLRICYNWENLGRSSDLYYAFYRILSWI